MIGKWELRYIELAKHISSWSKDPSTQVGAVIVGEKGQILSQGYNGFPRGVKDLPCRFEDKETKYKFTSHAEINCIYNASYNGVSLKDSSIYIWGTDGIPVCHECAKAIIQVGIKHVYCYNPYYLRENFNIHTKWFKSHKTAQLMFQEAQVEYFEVNS